MVAAARQVPSPNFDERPGGSLVELIVVHNISLPPGVFGGTGIIELFTNRLDPAEHPYYREIEGLRVSSHFLIRRDGEPIQFVACGKRAWHAGQSQWRGRSRCNDFSIGIELEGA
ncbi:MAG TPA: 1,6-anhydro-N-acetylmuramyl-L-alanine amidase AmpD, partial [Burkholderiales bacterium]